MARTLAAVQSSTNTPPTLWLPSSPAAEPSRRLPPERSPGGDNRRSPPYRPQSSPISAESPRPGLPSRPTATGAACWFVVWMLRVPLLHGTLGQTKRYDRGSRRSSSPICGWCRDSGGINRRGGRSRQRCPLGGGSGRRCIRHCVRPQRMVVAPRRPRSELGRSARCDPLEVLSQPISRSAHRSCFSS